MSDANEHYAKYIHRKDLTFRQAEGTEPLPEMLKYGELNTYLRNRIWDVIYTYFSVAGYNNQFSKSPHKIQAKGIAEIVARHALGMPIDDAKRASEMPLKLIEKIKNVILYKSYDYCLEIVQLLMRLNEFRAFVEDIIVDVFNDPVSPYMVIDFPPFTIIPRGEPTERDAFLMNWETIKTSTFEGARVHLRKSAEALNKGDHTGAIREAIHSIESATKIICNKPSATLGEALSTLEKNHGLHSALREAFSKLYGYTSSEKGIRHALLDTENGNVGQAEALFMFSTCTAFVAYLAKTFPQHV